MCLITAQFTTGQVIFGLCKKGGEGMSPDGQMLREA